MTHSAIIGFGTYLPKYRIKISDIARHWRQDPATVISSLGVKEKSVPGLDEDSFTLAFEAAREALSTSGVPSSEVSAIFVGSESHPYAVKTTSGMLVSALKLNSFSHAADLEFACKAGTIGMQIVDSFVRSGQIRFGIAVGTDTAQSKPGDVLEYTAAAGAAAFLLGPEEHKNAFSRIDKTLSFTTDTPDFWRVAGETFPRHAGRFTGEPGYFHHVRETLEEIIATSNIELSKIDHIVFHMPNVKFPMRIAREFGIKKQQLQAGLIIAEIGNTYSACSLLGLASALEKAKKDERILLVSYGSGAGCDALLLTMLKNGTSLPRDEREHTYLTYDEYLVHCGVRA